MLADDLCNALDPISFARSLGFSPDVWQARVLATRSRQTILNCHRQSGKSTTTSIIAVYQSLYWPESTVLLISPSLRQSSELFRKVRYWFSRMPGLVSFPEDNKLSCELSNGSRIISLPASESTVRGFSAVDLVIEDEASRVPDELYFSIRPMLAVSGGRIILMSTPFGRRGHFWEAWSKGGDRWDRFTFRADENSRINKGFLEEELATLGRYWYSQEYQCEFLDPVDSIFSYELVANAFTSEIEPLFNETKATKGEIGSAISKTDERTGIEGICFG